MPSNDREVWVSITSEHGSAVINYIAYALYSFEKYEWYHQIEKQKGQPPTAADTNDWISQITEVRMKTWQEGAARMFDVSARDYMDNRINTARQEAINHQVVISVRSSLDRYNEQFNECLKNVQKSSSFRNQLFVAF